MAFLLGAAAVVAVYLLSAYSPWRPSHRDAEARACAACWWDAPYYAWRWARRGFRPCREEE